MNMFLKNRRRIDRFIYIFLFTDQEFLQNILFFTIEEKKMMKSHENKLIKNIVDFYYYFKSYKCRIH